MTIAAHRFDSWAVRLVLVPLLASAGLLLTGIQARADGFIIPRPPPHVVEPVPDLAVRYHHVRVEIEDQIAHTAIDQVFVNDSPHELEGTYIFPLPEQAALTEFAMFVDGERLQGKILDAAEARRIYEDIVRRRRDPALLEYVGRNAFQASIYPIPAFGDKRVQLSYSEVLLKDNGLFRYVYPLSTEQFSSQNLEEVLITVELHSRSPLKAIYSPSHAVSVERTGTSSARVTFEASDVRPNKDFQLYYSASDDNFGLHMLSYKEPDEDGFFLCLIAPKLTSDEGRVAKDVTFVLDTSGSMEGAKLQQAKDAVAYVLSHLQEDDRFNVVAFDSAVRKYASGLRPASERGAAQRFVDQLSAGGGTDMHRALLEAVEYTDSARPQFVIFVTDGLPTVGETEPDRIVDSIAAAAPDSLRLFSFGVGYDVNTILLDSLSSGHRGLSAYVEPNQSIEEEVAAFYSKVSSPLLTDVRLTVRGVLTEDIYPYPLPDLFAGSQQLVTGRYRSSGTIDITLEGQVNGRACSFSYAAIELERRGGDAAIPRLWATRKIGHLLKAIRLQGENLELVDEIVALSIRYGIMTPYTSFLVDEEQDILTREGRDLLAASSELAAPSAMPMIGAKAVSASQLQNDLSATELAPSSQEPQLALIGSKTFVLRGAVWTDTSFAPDIMDPVVLDFAGSAYFDLLAARPEWGKYFAVGDHLIAVLDGKAYEIRPAAGSSGLVDSAARFSEAWTRWLNWLHLVGW